MVHYLLFSGHMIDKADRPVPRFPAIKEAAAKNAIRNIMLAEQERHAGAIQLKAIAGGACGGDILFHEVCLELNIPSEVYLTLNPEAFKKTSVSFAGNQWVERFDKLLQERPFLLLPSSYTEKEPDIWEATNQWMLDKALENGGKGMSLIALWDGTKGDGKGGTKHMVNIAQQQGAEVRIAYTGTL